MNRKYIKIVEKINAILSFCEDHINVINKNSILYSKYDELKTIIENINELINFEDIDIKGLSNEKKLKQKKLLEYIEKYPFIMDIVNKSDLNIYNVFKLEEDLSVVYLYRILSLLEENKIDTNITNKLSEDILEYEDFIKKYNSYIIKKKNLYQELKLYFNEYEKTVQIMDGIISGLGDKMKNIIEEYFKLRNDNNIGTASLKGYIRDVLTGTGVGNITIEIKELGLIKKTNKKGMYSFKNINGGKYTIVVSHNSFVKKELSNIFVNNSGVTKKNINIIRTKVHNTFSNIGSISLSSDSVFSLEPKDKNIKSTWYIINKSQVSTVQFWGSKIKGDENTGIKKFFLPAEEEIIISHSNIGEKNWEYLNFKIVNSSSIAFLEVFQSIMNIDLLKLIQ